ncbi:hypothetical protein C5S31_04935 [ANME-1 cluster archaeon GoMg2]|nr:hypothetical protein [ANME-1 cluster archaeon GoMg2]
MQCGEIEKIRSYEEIRKMPEEKLPNIIILDIERLSNNAKMPEKERQIGL